MQAFRGSEAVALGLVGKGALRGSDYVRLFPDVYLPADADPDLITRSRAAALLTGPVGGVLAGYSAAVLLGVDCAPRDAPAEVLVSGHVRSHPGLQVTRGTAVGDDLARAGGVPVTSPLRTAWDLARRLPRVPAVVAIDALAAHAGFAPQALLQRAAEQPGARGCRRLPGLVALADPRAESPPETRLRLLLVDAGLPPPEVQWELVHRGRLIARFDLAYPAARLAVEYDGGVHDDLLDRRRDIRTGRQGWYTARFTATDLTRPAATAAAVRALLAVRLAERDLSAPTA